MKRRSIRVKDLAYKAAGESCPQFRPSTKTFERLSYRHEDARRMIVEHLLDEGYTVLAGSTQDMEAFVRVKIWAVGGPIEIRGKPDILAESPSGEILVIEAKGSRRAASHGARLQLSTYLLALEAASNGQLYSRDDTTHVATGSTRIVGVRVDGTVTLRARPSRWPPTRIIGATAYRDKKKVRIERVRVGPEEVLRVLASSPELLAHTGYVAPGPYCGLCANRSCMFNMSGVGPA